MSDGVSLISHYPRTAMRSTTTVMGRRMTRQSFNMLAIDGSPRKESRVRLMEKPSHLKGLDRRESVYSSYSRRRSVRELETGTAPPPSKPKRPSEEKARRLNQIMDTLNKEREEKIKEEQRKLKKMTFEDIVSAAMNEQMVTDDNFSGFSGFSGFSN